MKYRISSSGDQGVSVEFEKTISIEVNNYVTALKRNMTDVPVEGILGMIATYCTLLVQYDAIRIPYKQLVDSLEHRLREIESLTLQKEEGRIHEIPVIYGGEKGPDLQEVALHSGLDEKEVIKRHTSVDYRVYMLGFTPGFPYLGGMDQQIATPRKASPRLKIEAGAVGIAGSQTGIYPVVSPGGWQIIGETSVKIFDLKRDNPFLIEAGDYIRFVQLEEGQSSDPPEGDAEKNAPEGLIEESVFDNCIEVINPGFLTTLQDQGRLDYQSYGVPLSGAMDIEALIIGNLLVGNASNVGALELTLYGGSYLFRGDAVMSLTGADMKAEIQRSYNGRTLSFSLVPWQSYMVKDGDRLVFGSAVDGTRSYLCVAGGFNVPSVLGSYSTYLRAGFGGYEGRALKRGDKLELTKDTMDRKTHYLSQGLLDRLRCEDKSLIRVVLGPQDDQFTEKGLGTFLQSKYEVTGENDRMGYRLKGEKIEHIGTGDIISDGLIKGAIQVPAHGQPMIMMADGQPTGGYTKIGYVVSSDLWKVAQAKQGDTLAFEAISVEASHGIQFQRKTLIKDIARTIRSQVPKPSRDFEVKVNGLNFNILVQEFE